MASIIETSKGEREIKTRKAAQKTRQAAPELSSLRIGLEPMIQTAQPVEASPPKSACKRDSESSAVTDAKRQIPGS